MNVTMGSGVQTIDEYAFSNCSSLNTIEIGKSVETIQQFAFENCIELNTIEIPPSVRTIGLYCFKGCSNLQAVTFNEGLKTISGGAFMGCPIKELVIPDSVTSILTYNYQYVGNYYVGDSYDGAFEGCTKLTSVTIGKGITSIERETFNGCTSLSTITFTGTVEQWNALSFGTDWRANVPATKVICSDGEVALN